MEHPPLVAGEPSRAAIHITDLEDFAPLDEGEVTLVLRSSRGEIEEFAATLSRPGIFGAELLVEQSGFYDLSLRIVTPGFRDLHRLDPVRVHAPGESVEHAEGHDESIAFLKEQQWTLDFGTIPAELRSLRPSMEVPALIEPRPGGEVKLSAPVPGRIDPASLVPNPGTRVLKAARLVRVIPDSDDLRDISSLEAALVAAEEEHALATSDRDRVARLVTSRALPARRLAEAEAALATAAARLEAARQRRARYVALSQSQAAGASLDAFLVSAPFTGHVSRVHFAPGAMVEKDQVLLELVDTERLHVVAAVPESRVGSLKEVDAGELLVKGEPALDLSRPLSIGRVIDPLSRRAEVRFSLEEGERYRVGQRVRVRLFLGKGIAQTSVPESALVEDAGRPVVFVQKGGESFERRPVKLGARAGGWVHVIEGVEEGERVVHEGAYLVRLSSMSTTIPAHGHVH